MSDYGTLDRGQNFFFLSQCLIDDKVSLYKNMLTLHLLQAEQALRGFGAMSK